MAHRNLYLTFVLFFLLCCSGPLEAQPHYAWVLTEARADNKAAEVKKHNAANSKSYRQQIDVSGNGITLLKKYIGKSHGTTVHGEHLGVRVEWSRMPKVVEPGKALDITLSMEVTSKYLKSLNMSTQATVDLGRMQKSGKLSGWTKFTKVGDPNTYIFSVNSRTGFAPVSVVVRKQFPNKAQPNDKVGVCVSAYNGIQPSVTYIYTWKKVVSKANEASKEIKMPKNKNSPFNE